ncbi:gliding motility-associated C-terminal domain-containing protein [Hymenobacter sp. M29]|uniref:Gliding motility-associated C-terminal domain-containing protein n=1 Tax=Hymenobacter mellowenesis TaxID=3063995 RepID=A0ABT9ABK6_9BACT|nr:gliding motility-associated C-terminal domain-containing protein [Hymenobacter sp. M29]MDO7847223.1 gliding motility-associated C-terminal domain-containing protein [Hymenobacter sp. M29]
MYYSSFCNCCIKRFLPGLLLSCLLLLQYAPTLAQADYSRWYFGNRAGIAFLVGTPPVTLTDGVMTSGEGCASIADAQGNLLFYTNGILAWNKLHQPLANGFGLGGFGGASERTPSSATQGAAIVAKPGSATEYYIFALDAAENGLRNGLVYSVVDMSRQGGLGEVVSKAMPIPVPVGDGRITEKMAVVRHANQRDIWVIVHAWGSNMFCSFLLTANGISTSPALSAGGNMHWPNGRSNVNSTNNGGNFASNNYDAIGYMKVSPDGRRLALAQYQAGQVQLFDFNCGTGTISNPVALDAAFPNSYGVEFSPNSNLLYVSGGAGVRQYNLLTAQTVAISSTITLGALQLGPDGRIYQVSNSASLLNVIAAPDRAGLACNYMLQAISLAPNRADLGLPNLLVRPPAASQPLVTFSVIGTEVCVGETTDFTAAIFPVQPGAAISWDFGEASSGPLNVATGPTASHRYASVGTYTATMHVRTASGSQYSYSQPVHILARFSGHVTLFNAAAMPFCAGTSALLSVPPAFCDANLTWQDGSHGISFSTRTPGVYWVDVAVSPQCVTRDSVVVRFQPDVVVRPLGPDREIPCNGSVVLDATSAVAGTTYRWQDGSSQPTLRARLPGKYFVTLTSPNGCTGNSSVQLRAAACPPGTTSGGITASDLLIPNVITPNGDDLNEAFIIQDLPPSSSSLHVYNRWGKAVFETENYNNNWDATGQPAGQYYYYLFVHASKQSYRGWVEVIR